MEEIPTHIIEQETIIKNGYIRFSRGACLIPVWTDEKIYEEFSSFIQKPINGRKCDWTLDPFYGELSPNSGYCEPQDRIPWLLDIVKWLYSHNIPFAVAGKVYLGKDKYGHFNVYPWGVSIYEWYVPNATWTSEKSGEPTITKVDYENNKIN